MSWQPEVDELKRRIDMSNAVGGPKNITRGRTNGKVAVREPIERLIDPDTFHEVGSLTARPTYGGDRLTDINPSNFVFGKARIDGRR